LTIKEVNRNDDYQWTGGWQPEKAM